MCLDGLYYHLDVTWGDANGNTACFLKSDADFAGHTLDAEFSAPEFTEQYPIAEKSYFDQEKG